MTLCNMSIEAGATAAIVPPDEVTFSYVAGRRFAPSEVAWPTTVAGWRMLTSDPGAAFDRVLAIDAASLAVGGARMWIASWIDSMARSAALAPWTISSSAR